MSTQSSIENLTSGANELVDLIAGAYMEAGKTAADRLRLAMQVAGIRQRMEAVRVVLESVTAQRRQYLGMAAAEEDPVLKALYVQQSRAFAAEQVRLLGEVGMEPEAAQAVVLKLGEPADTQEKLYRRQGKRYVALAGGKEQAG